jgi:hypothetical protein
MSAMAFTVSPVNPSVALVVGGSTPPPPEADVCAFGIIYEYLNNLVVFRRRLSLSSPDANGNLTLCNQLKLSRLRTEKGFSGQPVYAVFTRQSDSLMFC